MGHRNGRHILLPQGEVVFERGAILIVGHAVPGEGARRVDHGRAIIAPGFVDLDARSDLDTTTLSFDITRPGRPDASGRRSYMDRGPCGMYSPEELACRVKDYFGAATLPDSFRPECDKCRH